MFSQTGMPQWGQWALLILAVALLVLGIVLLLRRLIGSRISLPGQSRARQPRLGIVDIYDLDRRRQLVLLRRDNVEHLLLIGGPNDVVVESNIARLPPRQATSHPDVPERAPTPVPPPERTPIEPPRPAVEPPSASASEEARSPRDPAPPARDQARRKDPAAGEAKSSDAKEELAPVVATGPVPVSARPEPVLRAEPVNGPPRGAAPAFPPVPVQGVKPPLPGAPAGNAAPNPANAPSTAAPSSSGQNAGPRPGGAPAGGPVHSSPIPFPVAGLTQPPRPPEKGSDERAKGTPAAGPAPTKPAPTPAPGATAGPASGAASGPAGGPGSARPPGPASGASGPAAAGAPAAPVGGPSPRVPDSAILSDMTRQLEQALRRPSTPVNPDRPGEPAAVSASSPDKKPADQATPTDQAKAQDPFSVEEIEAEFARLLGRNDKT